MTKIDNKDKLKKYLLQFVRESVSEAYRAVNEQEDKDTPDFLKDDEEEAEEETEEESEEVEVKDTASEEEVDSEVEAETETEEVPEPLEGIDNTPKSLFRLINFVRSGKSIKRGEVRDELKSYFENLSEPEQVALIEFLTGLSDIIVRGETAEEAEDPGDEVKMVSRSEKQKTEEEETQKPEEDTSPPIKVVRN